MITSATGAHHGGTVGALRDQRIPARADVGDVRESAQGHDESPNVQPAARTGERGRIRQLDGVRALAFLAVFVHHAFGVPMLWWGVDLFFAMSGFLITGILLQQSRASGYFSTFYIRRAFRIVPPYLLVVTVAMLYFSGDRATLPWYLTFFSNVLFALRPGAQHFAVLIPTWSLSVEEQFYVLWPLLVFVTPVRHFWRVAVVAIVAAPVFRAGLTVVTHQHWAVYYLLPARIDGLAAGALLAWLFFVAPQHRERYRRSAPWLLLIAVGLFGLLTAAVPTFRTSANGLTFNVLGYSLCALAASAAICWTVCLRPGSFGDRILTVRPIRFVGSISYMMYLVHEMALDIAHHQVANRWIAAALAFAGTAVVASGSWYLVERPVLRLKDRLFPGRGKNGARPVGAAPSLPAYVGRA